MPDDRNIDWGRLPAPDLVGDYADAFQRGRRLASQSAAAPTAPPSLSDVVASHIGQLGPPQRQAAGRRIEALSQVLLGLRGATSDPVERLRMAQHLARATPGLRLRPGDVGLKDVTDRGLAGHLARLTVLGRHIASQSDASPTPSRYVGPLRQAASAPQGGARYIGPAR